MRSGLKPFNSFSEPIKPRHINTKVDLIFEQGGEYSDGEENVYNYEVNEFARNTRRQNVDRNVTKISGASPSEVASDGCQCLKAHKMNTMPVNILNKNNCPYCRGTHSYRECPLPLEERDIHCFVCQSRQHIATQCPHSKKQKISSIESRDNIISSTHPTIKTVKK